PTRRSSDLLQPSSWLEDKRTRKFRSIYLYIHGVIHGLLAYLLLAEWQMWYVPLLVALSHIGIDGWKIHNQENTKNFLIDQFLHVIVLIIIWLLAIDQIKSLDEIIKYYFEERSFWIYLMGYMVVVWPMRF